MKNKDRSAFVIFMPCNKNNNNTSNNTDNNYCKSFSIGSQTVNNFPRLYSTEKRETNVALQFWISVTSNLFLGGFDPPQAFSSFSFCSSCCSWLAVTSP